MTPPAVVSNSTTVLLELCSKYSLPQPIYDLEAVGRTYTMCCMVETIKETGTDDDKSEAKIKAADKVIKKLREFLDNKENILDISSIKIKNDESTKITKLHDLQSQLSPNVTQKFLMKLKTKEISLEEFCAETGLAGPVYDIETIGVPSQSQVTMCCVAGGVKETGAGGSKEEGRLLAAAKVLDRLIAEVFAKKCQ